ncbi:hypothetical protein GCM10027160_28980 [Streptomyces calidiresistens]
MSSRRYRVLRGLTYRPAGKRGGIRRANRGEVVEDLPVRSIEWLTRRGAVSEEPAGPEGGEADEHGR